MQHILQKYTEVELRAYLKDSTRQQRYSDIPRYRHSGRLYSLRWLREYFLRLLTSTSLAFALAYTEMFTLAKQVAASTASIMPLFIAGLFYYIFNFLVAMVMEKLEKRMQYFD